MRLSRFGPPSGLDHGKARVEFSVVEKCRDLHEYEKKNTREIAELMGLNKDTIRDWIEFRTRIYG